MTAAIDYHDALPTNSELPPSLPYVSARRGAQLVDIALPSRDRRENTHIACRSRVSTHIIRGHPYDEVPEENRRPTHTSCTQAYIHDGHCRKCGVHQNLKAFRRTKGCRIDVCRECELMQCIACTATFPQTCFTRNEISNHFTRATPVVCPQCKNRGCTARCPHPEFHRCAGPCQRILGRAAYTSRAWSMKNTAKSYSIVCTTCQDLMTATKKRKNICQALHTSCVADPAKRAANDYHDALPAKSALPPSCQSLSDRRDAHLLDIALPSSERHKDTHIACPSRVSPNIVEGHAAEDVHKESRKPAHTSSKQAYIHDGHCRKCGVHQKLKAFRRTNGYRIDVCRDCELMQCIACTATFPQSCFTPNEINNHFTRATPVVCPQCKNRGCTARCPHPVFHRCSGPCQKILGRAAYTSRAWSKMNTGKSYNIVCTSCRKDEAAHMQTRLQHLRQLMQTSKRRRCVCPAKKPHLHATRCPMYMTFAGEILYPGCDVMTAEDSAWLRKRDKRYRLRRHGGRHLNLNAEAK